MPNLSPTLGTAAAWRTYGLDASGIPVSLLQGVRVPGALGAFNSIVIGDFDRDQKGEIWLAASSGLKEFEET